MTSPPAESPRARWIAFAAVAALSIVPVALVRYPPVVDLAQQVAQIPLLSHALGDQADRYLVQWTAPNKLSYPLLALGWWIGGVEYGPRLGLALCMIATLGGIHLLGAKLGRPISHVVLASVFLWNTSLYWGFFNFLLGTLGFALLLPEILARRQASSFSTMLRAAAIALLFYWCHVVWLAAAVGLLMALWLFRLQDTRSFLLRMVAFVPFLLAAALWNFTTADWKVEDRIQWVMSPLQRLVDPGFWRYVMLGSLDGPWESLALAATVVFVLAAIGLSARRNGVHRGLLISAAAFLLAVLSLPNAVDEAILFEARWGPLLAISLVLAVPELPWRRAGAVYALVVAGLFVAVTASTWWQFGRSEMHGFDAAIAAVPRGAHLLSLDFSLRGQGFLDRRTLQMAAYAQLERDADLGFSFSEHRSSLVVERRLPRDIHWTRKLEWHPTRLVDRDLDAFDVVLVRGSTANHLQLTARFPRLEEIAGQGDWRLYRVRGSGSTT